MAKAEETAPYLVDARGMRCPWPVIRTARAMRDHDAVRVLADDPLAPSELEGLAAERGWHFLAGGDGFELRR